MIWYAESGSISPSGIRQRGIFVSPLRANIGLTEISSASLASRCSWLTIVSSRSDYCRANAAAASCARSMNASPLTSMTTRVIVPPVNAHGRSPG